MSSYFKIEYGLSLIFVCFCIKRTEALCNATNRFGPDCEFKCHCMNNRQCDNTTGECPSGCDFEWVGPACQRRNIVFSATRRMARHQIITPPAHFAPLAVDKNSSTCSITRNNYRPWWRLWMSSKHNIRNISILTGINHLDDFKKFQVMIENSTSRNRYSDRDLCYTHSDTAMSSASIDIACNRTLIGNQIRIQLAGNNTQLMLCDVRIYGECDNGLFGAACTDKCSTHCEGVCDKDDGTCTCKSGWTGSRCAKVCTTGRWGLNCANVCGHCVSEMCRQTDGVCDGGCVAGFHQTPHCDKECDTGSYGINCSSVCSKNCEDICNKRSGGCQFCKSGWHGAKCTLECVDGKWGENCDRICFTCHNHTCNRFSGKCNGQCKPGFKQTPYCDQECDSGWYGINCSKKCSPDCKDINNCRKTDGVCSECKPGMEGIMCETESGTNVHVNAGSVAGILATFLVLISMSVLVTALVTRRQLKAHRSRNNFENATVSYSNALAEELNRTELTETTYDTIKRTSGIEHIYE